MRRAHENLRMRSDDAPGARREGTVHAESLTMRPDRAEKADWALTISPELADKAECQRNVSALREGMW